MSFISRLFTLIFIFGTFSINATRVPLSEIEKLLEDRFGKYNFHDDSIITEQEWKELRVDDFISTFYNKPGTKLPAPIGNWSLRRTLVPTRDVIVIQERQAQLRALLNDRELFEQVTATLHTAPEALTDINADLTHKDMGILSGYYFQFFDSYLNRNEYILSSAFAVEAAKRIAFLVAPLGMMGLDEKMKLDVFQDNKENYFSPSYIWEGFKQGITGPLRWHLPGASLLSTPEDIRNAQDKPGAMLQKILWGGSTMGDCYTYGTQVLGWNKPVVCAAIALSFLGRDAFIVLQAKGSLDYLTNLWYQPVAVAHDIAHIGKAVKACRALAKKLSGNVAFQSQRSQRMLALLAFNEQLLSDDLKEAIELAITISESSSFNLMLRGRVLLANKLLTERAAEFAPHIEAIGYIDALCAMTELFQYQSQTKPWSFVNFVYTKTPEIYAQNSWCPLIENHDPVLNTVHIGGERQRVMICTGPNGGGKSTIMKGLAYQIILGQSWGIVPAESCTMSLFGSLGTALDPHEDVKKGLSSFMAQRKRMNDLESQAHAARELPMLLLVDEPYRGTVEATSQRMVTSFCESIGECSQVGMFLATHFQMPTALSEEKGDQFENVQCLFDTDADGRMYRTFKLAPGAATWWFSDDHARSQYLSMLEEEVGV